MSLYIQNYSGRHCILSVAKNAETVEILSRKGVNYIFINDEGTQINIDNVRYNVQIKNVNADALEDFDVIEILENGIADIIYQRMSTDNAFVVTMRCNSNCIMCPCSERSRKHGFISSIERLKDMVMYTPKSAEYITITGGEPCLLKENLFVFMKMLQYELYNTEFLMLTNGRAFSIPGFTEKFISNKPNKMRVAIPIYGYNTSTHDAITQTAGSFMQTVQGINNLLHYKMDIEIRIVVSKLNISYMQQIADFIVSNFKGIIGVHFMAIEMLGNAVKNADKVWIPYEHIFEYIREPILTIIKNGIDVQLYNFPLCTVSKEFRGICKKSISEYKVRFADNCDKCAVKSLCGGMFESTKRYCDFKPNPITQEMMI